MGNGRAALKVSFEESIEESAGDAAKRETGVGIKIFVFGGKGGVDEVFGKGGEPDGGAAFGFEYFINKSTMAIQEPGGGWGGTAGEIFGVGEIPEEVKRQSNKETERKGCGD